MPSWPVHIALANKLKKEYNLNDDFIIGNILPDVLDGYILIPSNITDKNISHYRTKGKIDYDLFLKEHKNNLNNPIILGYFVHLLTDKFYNLQTAKNHYIKDKNETKIILNNKKIISKNKTTLEMKQKELTQYGHILKNKLGAKIKINKNTKNNLKTLPFNYSPNDIKTTIEIINSWIENKVENKQIPFKLYTKEELDKMYEECYKYIIKYLNTLKRTN